MGAIISKFRKEKTTVEVLEQLEEDIKEIEEYTISTQARQKRYVGNLLVVSIILYIICFLVFYFAFFPPTWVERITYSVPLLIFPFVIFLLKHLVAWFFQRKLNDKSLKLRKLKNEKKKVLEKVMEKETYKVALDILNRFGDKSNGFNKGITLPTIEVKTPAKPISSSSPILKPQIQMQTPNSQNPNLVKRHTPNSQQMLQQGLSNLPNQTGLIGNMMMTSTPVTPLSRLQAIQQRALSQYQVQRRRTPFPIINPQEKSVLDKFVDYLIGDGIQNRFAMICKECFGHNGMAFQEEYEYASYKCVYCNAFNQSRKSRPVAPRLPTPRRSGGSESDTSSEVGDDKKQFQKEQLEENNELPVRTEENVEVPITTEVNDDLPIKTEENQNENAENEKNVEDILLGNEEANKNGIETIENIEKPMEEKKED